jgi:crossover junction endodeoxyribonuclease RusA
VEPLTITVPLVPPSVNHYWKHTRFGRHYVTAEGRAYKEAIALCAGRQSVRAKYYEIEAVIFLGYGQRGDVDNFGKAIGDGLVEAGVIHSDAAVTDLILRKRRDSANPRTEITVKAAEG